MKQLGATDGVNAYVTERQRTDNLNERKRLNAFLQWQYGCRYGCSTSGHEHPRDKWPESSAIHHWPCGTRGTAAEAGASSGRCRPKEPLWCWWLNPTTCVRSELELRLSSGTANLFPDCQVVPLRTTGPAFIDALLVYQPDDPSVTDETSSDLECLLLHGAVRPPKSCGASSSSAFSRVAFASPPSLTGGTRRPWRIITSGCYTTRATPNYVASCTLFPLMAT
jgi:hypothetical protein